MSNIIIETYKIRTGMGSIHNPGVLTFLSEDELSDLNTIGYTSKLNGIRTSREAYLNSLGKGTFLVQQTKTDSGDFAEEFTITRSYVNGSLKTNVLEPNYKIKITGSGTVLSLKTALLDIVEAIKEAEKSDHPTSAILDGAEWENSILMTEINEI